MASSHSSRPKSGHGNPRKSNHRSTLSLQKKEIKIHVYDLLPPGKVSSFLWAVGGSLLHSGVVIKDKEYAYGGHDHRGVTGVYWTRPGLEPPGGTFRTEVLQGFCFATDEELDAIIREASHKFQGMSYNLLTFNCNHFTSYLCEKLTGKPAPGWLNRAASIGVALPCVVPREWIAPPDHDTADGELLDDDEDDERAAMLHGERRKLPPLEEHDDGLDRTPSRSTPRPGSRKGKVPLARNSDSRLSGERDTSGRKIPPAERAPVS
ncbi:uncharacterized protein K452DRAFT_220918 [Aplosporella prunicola CBS 121167]|uniref:PPPDE domain-containing protein n=1 Tax=Aplosporella prunicola CBS 121167 TaxID=1176127 RepID=A0A6A6BPX5_9PEZI|nr:uncharacterized protein K452DRAFT_220918 [Aplosporella prunicola CBS 121167]KAF2145355.1 hypothetical protein K452DRAFT_220918 [Aplosporella prunicola CBS 121167]